MAQLITILNGPNLNLLGQRQPEIYGHDTLDDVANSCTAVAAQFGLRCELMQSNHEGALIDMIHTARQTSAGIIINPAAFTHTSVALRDAFAAVGLPFIEAHLSNPHSREPFRQHSYFSDLAKAVICGFGPDSYRFALTQLMQWFPASAADTP